MPRRYITAESVIVNVTSGIRRRSIVGSSRIVHAKWRISNGMSFRFTFTYSRVVNFEFSLISANLTMSEMRKASASSVQVRSRWDRTIFVRAAKRSGMNVRHTGRYTIRLARVVTG